MLTRNIALGCRATQSSVSRWSRGLTPELDAAGAVNGDATEDYAFHTDYEAHPWWRVDLGRPVEVRELRVFNRAGDATQRARAFPLVVSVSLDGETWQAIGRIEDDPGSSSAPLICALAAPVLARHVRLQADRRMTALHLAEVEVHVDEAVAASLSRPSRVGVLTLGSFAPKVFGRTMAMLADPRLRVFLHVDAKQDLARYLQDAGPAAQAAAVVEPRVSIFWGGWSMIEAEFALIRAALADPSIDRMVLISDDSALIQSPDALVAALTRQPDRMAFEQTPHVWQRYSRVHFADSRFSSIRPVWFMDRNVTEADCEELTRLVALARRGKKPLDAVYFSRQWWSLSRRTAEALLDLPAQDEHLMESFRFTVLPDEIYFATAYRMFVGRRRLPDVPTYANYEHKPSPQVFREAEELRAARWEPHHFFIRKIAPGSPHLVDVAAERW